MGKIELDHTGSGSGITLSSDGTNLLLGGTAIGGGGGDPDLYRDNPVSATTPTASGNNAVAIGTNAQATNTNAVALTRNALASGNASFAAGNNAAATGTNAVALGSSTDAAERAVAIGSGSQAVQQNTTAIGTNSSSQAPVAGKFGGGAGAIALGGSYSAGTDSFAAGIANNTSSYGAQSNNGIAMGMQAKAHDSQYSIAIGRNNISSGGSGCTVIGGQNNEATSTSSIITGGANCSITGGAQYARAGGGYSKAAVHGKDVFASGQFSSVGDAQGAKYILRADTTDATATVLTTSNGNPASWNQIVAASDTCITFDGTITAMQNGAQAYASWRIEGLLVNDGGTTTLANSATTVIQNASSWGMALSADNTNNALTITCTGEASHNIRWVANIRTSEVTYA
jgi:enamine deaminase RidA (YjgF/YER057c/UK114 family)